MLKGGLVSHFCGNRHEESDECGDGFSLSSTFVDTESSTLQLQTKTISYNIPLSVLWFAFFHHPELAEGRRGVHPEGIHPEGDTGGEVVVANSPQLLW